MVVIGFEELYVMMDTHGFRNEFSYTTECRKVFFDLKSAEKNEIDLLGHKRQATPRVNQTRAKHESEHCKT